MNYNPYSQNIKSQGIPPVAKTHCPDTGMILETHKTQSDLNRLYEELKRNGVNCYMRSQNVHSYDALITDVTKDQGNLRYLSDVLRNSGVKCNDRLIIKIPDSDDSLIIEIPLDMRSLGKVFKEYGIKRDDIQQIIEIPSHCGDLGMKAPSIPTHSDSEKPDINTNETKKANLPARLLIYNKAYEKIIEHAKRKPKLECGGFLIGNLGRDEITGVWIGIVDDVFSDDSVGEQSTYKFSPQMILSASNYCKKTYSNDWDLTKHIIGNYHSHGTHSAFFSATDRDMMHTQATNEFYLVYSPSHKNFVVCFMDDKFSVYNVEIMKFDNKNGKNSIIKNEFLLSDIR